MRVIHPVAFALLLAALPTFADTGLTALDTRIGSPGAVIVDLHGNVIFSSDPGVVFKLDPSGVLTQIAGGWTPGFSGDGGPAAKALLAFPLVYPELVNDPVDFSPLVGGLASDASGQIYIADAYNNRIRKIDAQGMISTVAGSGAKGGGGNGAPALDTALFVPQGVAVDATGNLIIADGAAGLEKITSDDIVHLVAPNNCGKHSAPGLCAPEQIALDASGAAYVADGYCDIRKINPAGAVTEVAGDPAPTENNANWTCGYSGDGGRAIGAALNFPYAVAVDRAGDLFIADSWNHCVRRVDANGVITTFAGVCRSPGFAGDGGPARTARLNKPLGVAVDSAGNVYIADTANHRLRKVAVDGMISTVAGNGSAAPATALTESTTTLVGSASGTQVTLTATVTSTVPLGTPTGLGYVTFIANGEVIASAPIKSDMPNSATTQVRLNPGEYTVSAAYEGNLFAAASTSAPVQITIAASSTSSSSTSSASAATTGGGGAMGFAEVSVLLLLALARRRL